MVAMFESSVERGGKTTSARRHYLSSAKLSAEQFARAVRAHWGIENRLDGVMDVLFTTTSCGFEPNTDRQTRQPSDTPLNLIRAIKDKGSLKVRLKTLTWDDDYLLTAVTETAP